MGEEHSLLLIKLIGFAEIGMVVWILSRIKPRLNAITQMGIVGTMNILEFALVPDLLLWGKANTLFAALFILLIYYNEFVLNKVSGRQSQIIETQ